MAQAYSLLIASGSTNGLGVKVTGTNSAGAVTVHTAVTGTTDFDLVTLEAYNDDTVPITLAIEFGGTTDPDNVIRVEIPPRQGPIPVITDLPLRNGLVVKAFAGTANKVIVYAKIKRVDEP